MFFYVFIKIFYANAEIQRLPLHRESLFTEIFYNTYLHVNLIAQYDVRNSMQCAFHCLHINQCRSFNLKKGTQTSTCILLPTDRRNADIKDFVNGTGWIYYDAGRMNFQLKGILSWLRKLCLKSS